MLHLKHPHPKDNNITVEESTHTYCVLGAKNFKSVTTFIHDYFPKFNADEAIDKMMNGKNWGPSSPYYTMTKDEIKALWSKNGKESSEKGTLMHAMIENFYNKQPVSDEFYQSKEGQMFLNFVEDYSIEPYRTEWKVYSKKYQLAGSIDMVFKDPNEEGKYIICDWKRSKDIKMSNRFAKGLGVLKDVDDCNYMHYTLQLNIYRLLLENYYGIKITHMFLVVLHPDNDEYLKIDIDREDDLVMAMFDDRLKIST
jgi:ATP-dependent exoDNAse (exonuclease V) beta subunit